MSLEDQDAPDESLADRVRRVIAEDRDLFDALDD